MNTDIGAIISYLSFAYNVMHNVREGLQIGRASCLFGIRLALEF